MNINEELVKKLKTMKADGASVVEVLEQIKLNHKDEPQITPLCMKYFRESYGLSLPAVIPIGGWCGIGGKLSNEEIIGLIEPFFND